MALLSFGNRFVQAHLKALEPHDEVSCGVAVLLEQLSAGCLQTWGLLVLIAHEGHLLKECFGS